MYCYYQFGYFFDSVQQLYFTFSSVQQFYPARCNNHLIFDSARSYFDSFKQFIFFILCYLRCAQQFYSAHQCNSNFIKILAAFDFVQQLHFAQQFYSAQYDNNFIFDSCFDTVRQLYFIFTPSNEQQAANFNLLNLNCVRSEEVLAGSFLAILRAFQPLWFQ